MNQIHFIHSLIAKRPPQSYHNHKKIEEEEIILLTHVSSDIFVILFGTCFDPKTRAAFEGETSPNVEQLNKV